MAARVHNERPRCQERFDFLKQEGAFLATSDQARRWRVHHEGRTFDLRRERGDVRLARGVLGPSERSARSLRLQAPNRDSRNRQLVGCLRRGWEWCGIEL